MSVSEPCDCCDGVRSAEWSGRRALGRLKLLSISADEPICSLGKDDDGEDDAQSTGAASPSAPALYWIPAGSFPVGVLNCGSSLHSAMSSTYWDSAETARIVSNYFWASVRWLSSRSREGHDFTGCGKTQTFQPKGKGTSLLVPLSP
jgi:hypothetical protein